jgi:hypothetical protein
MLHEFISVETYTGFTSCPFGDPPGSGEPHSRKGGIDVCFNFPRTVVDEGD